MIKIVSNIMKYSFLLILLLSNRRRTQIQHITDLTLHHQRLMKSVILNMSHAWFRSAQTPQMISLVTSQGKFRKLPRVWLGLVFDSVLCKLSVCGLLDRVNFNWFREKSQSPVTHFLLWVCVSCECCAHPTPAAPHVLHSVPPDHQRSPPLQR